MTKTSTESLVSKENLIELLKRVQQNTPLEKPNVEYSEHNWHKPRHFSLEQLAALKLFSEKVAEHIQADMTNLCHGDFRVSTYAITEHFSYTLEKDFYNTDQNYYLNFGNSPGKFQGFISISKKSAMAIVKFVLGEDEEQDSDNKSITTLEESLLFDTAETALRSLNKTSQGRDGETFSVDDCLLRGNWPLDLDNLEELCRIDFKIENRTFSAEISLIIVSDLLEPALRISGEQQKITEEDIKNAIVSNLKNVPINIKTKISTETLPMQEISRLQPGDVVLLNKSIEEPIEILANGKVLLHANPGIYNNRYAVTITHKEDD